MANELALGYARKIAIIAAVDAAGNAVPIPEGVAAWASDNAAVATVRQDGWVLSVGLGAANINFSIGGAGGTFPLEIGVGPATFLTAGFDGDAVLLADVPPEVVAPQ